MENVSKISHRLSIVVAIILIATGVAASSTVLHLAVVEGSTLGANSSQSLVGGAFVGGAIVNGQSESQKITCSTGNSKNTNGLQFSAHTRMGVLQGYWDIASLFAGAENKGGNIYDGKTDGKTYELKGKETHDGICQAIVPKNIIISGNCGTGEHKIYYETIQGLSHTFTGNVKCLGHTTNN
jgi:hypothetical protein